MEPTQPGPHPDWEQARLAAVEVLLHNAHGPYGGLPRTAGWGYPEPYTRDWMIAAFGILTTDNQELIDALRQVLIALAANQTPRGHIPSLAHDPSDRGASDTTPLFLIALELFRQATGEPEFLSGAAHKALLWMQYQSPEDNALIGQLATSDWRDEQWVMGYGLYVNMLVYIYLQLFGLYDRAAELRKAINRPNVRIRRFDRVIPEGLRLNNQPYYALWVYKALNNPRFDLLGNSLTIICSVASPERSKQIIAFVESSCEQMRRNGDLGSDLPPCFFPYIYPGDSDWVPRYAQFNQPGEYHNGGIWPFVSAFYIVALVAAGERELATKKMNSLTEMVKITRANRLEYGFNEWFRAQDCQPMGQEWQTWSAAMYLYALAAVETGTVPLLEGVRMAGRFLGERPSEKLGKILPENREFPNYGSIDEML